MSHQFEQLQRPGIAAPSALVVLLCVVATCLPADLEAQAIERHLERGELQEANREAFLRDDAASLTQRSRFALWAGDDEDARHFAETAVEVATGDDARRTAELQLARIEWFFGERDAAIARLRQLLQTAPQNPEVRFELGRRLIDDGAGEEGRAVLEAVARRYNNGLFDEIDELVWVGRAMNAADRPRDANRALSAALREDEEHLEANLRLGQLMWDYHNTAEAEEAFEKVLQHSEDHPEAVVGMANIEFYQSGRFADSMDLVDRAVEHYPGHPGVQKARAELLIAQGRWSEGQEVAERLLERSPQNGRALSLLAAATHLRGDQTGFEDAVDRFEQRRTDDPALYTAVGEIAARNNRHRASVQFFERALERDSDHAAALAGLGKALTRIGEEARGIEVLQRAYDIDQFRVPVYNKLELYDRGLDDYITDDLEGFRLRAHDEQYELIRHLLEPLVADARDRYSRRYGVELPSLTLEVFADPESFSVRSVGLPHVDPQGICFGRVVLTRGPGEGNFNWHMILWHELAHAYHLEVSDERVPRWFTEGLAEYETLQLNPSWTRFRDLAIARLIQHGGAWSIDELDRAFMSGRGVEVVHAYQYARLFFGFLEDVHGFGVVVDLLEQFRETPEMEPAFRAVLDESVSGLSEQFEGWLRDHFSGLLGQRLLDRARLRRMMRDDAEVEHPTDAQRGAYRAVVAARQGEEERARIQLRNSSRSGEFDADAAVARVVAFAQLDDIEQGLEAGRAFLDEGAESFDVRIALSRMALQADRREEAYVHALVATQLAPKAQSGWQQLARAADAAGEDAALDRARQMRFDYGPHDRSLARARVGFFEEAGDYHEAYRATTRWTEIAALDARSHEARGRMAARLDRLETAVRAFERAAMAAPARRAQIFENAAEEFERAGDDELAQRFRHRAVESGD